MVACYGAKIHQKVTKCYDPLSDVNLSPEVPERNFIFLKSIFCPLDSPRLGKKIQCEGKADRLYK